jgi:glyoxylase-like metal-dependent hydrolase (beta-lactamase superfamily II)
MSGAIKWAGLLILTFVGCAGKDAAEGATSTSAATTAAVPPANPLPTQWHGNGSVSCRNHQNEDPAITVFRYDPNTWILRENKCLNFEGNFIHLMFGHDKVLMQDTGSNPQGMSQSAFAQAFPIRDTIEGIISQWLAEQPPENGHARTRDSIELLVTHSHSHGDHIQGDFQFVGQPHTTVVGKSPTQVAAFFGLVDWPNKSSSLDLGNRKLDILPIPGHEAAHIAVYDHGAQLLFSGDSIYPGHIFIQDWTTYRASMQRLEAFLSETDGTGTPLRPVIHVLGTHIEKPPEARQFYRYGTTVQNPERKLELDRAHVTLVATKTAESVSASNIITDELSLEP